MSEQQQEAVPAVAAGALAIVLHTHMPYVEGFGTWPFGEEWLWEAIATCYLPLLDLLDAGAPLTVSLTPVLCDQLEVSDLAARFQRFVHDVRTKTHLEDARGLRQGGYERLAAEVQRALDEDYLQAARRLEQRGGDLLAAFAPYAQWTSAATHAVLPLLATDLGVHVQAQAGIDSHEARFGDRWRGGFWLPECAYAPYLEPTLVRAGVKACCVELTNDLGLGALSHLHPLVSDSGLTLVPIDRQTISLVWSDAGYPSHPRYRDYHRHTIHHHNPWSNDGEPYDRQAAIALAKEHAADFVARVKARLAAAAAAEQSDGAGGARSTVASIETLGVKPATGRPLAVCALDTELLGHWWYEGVHWISAVVEECVKQRVPLLRLDDALAGRELDRSGDSDLPSVPGVHARARRALRADAAQTSRAGPGSPAHAGLNDARYARPISPVPDSLGGATRARSWGKDGDLSTWSCPPVAELAFAQRAAELRLLRADAPVSVAALRHLLAMQSSDWAFMIARDLATPYARERFEAHRAGFEQAIAAASPAGEPAAASVLRNPAPRSPALRNPALRNLACHGSERHLAKADV